MKVVQLHSVSLRDIPAMARQFADDIEKGEYEDAHSAVVILDCASSVHTFSWGDCETVQHALGVMELGKAQIVRSIFGDD
jgi:hypothetical protein